MGFFRKMTEEEQSKPAQELVELRAAVQKAQLPEAVAAVAAKELERLDKTDPSVAEYTIGINYLDYLISLPWNRFTEDNLDLKRAERILESQHYGLQHVKERILEFLAVRTLCSVQTSQILVVDDEEIARTNLEYILRKEGHQVATAANGLEALEKVKAQEFDVELLGLDLFQGFQAIGRGGHLVAFFSQDIFQVGPGDFLVVHHQDLGGLDAAQGADRQKLQDALFDVLEAIMLGLQDALRPLEVEVIFREAVPGQGDQVIQVVDANGVFGHGRVSFVQPLQFLGGNGGHRLRQLGFLHRGAQFHQLLSRLGLLFFSHLPKETHNDNPLWVRRITNPV